ncbi:HpcH/HpaI aldolase/citrate lyase family protein [Variovorax sp. PvP013]|uniref:HpcH/HpaI aldolase/citrate lyase family protein n=1 Tax=Variovorax sp. PvP013 TaxID=3156435 RepID=UPI003D262BAD
MHHLPRSYLFVLGDRPERFDKAVASGAHRIILDLEDAVAPTSKDVARAAVSEWLVAHPGVPALVRINAVNTVWFEADLSMLAGIPGAGLVCPKAEPDAMAAALEALRSSVPREAVALIETVRGLLDLRATAALPGVGRLAFGSIDFSLDAGTADGVDEPGMTAARTTIALESRYASLPAPIDGVSTEIDGDTVRVHADRARRLGFGGKLCIHPRQVDTVLQAFAPTAEERRWAMDVIAAFKAAGGSAVSLRGQMIDLPVVERASRIVAG